MCLTTISNMGTVRRAVYACPLHIACKLHIQTNKDFISSSVHPVSILIVGEKNKNEKGQLHPLPRGNKKDLDEILTLSTSDPSSKQGMISKVVQHLAQHCFVLLLVLYLLYNLNSLESCGAQNY